MNLTIREFLISNLRLLVTKQCSFKQKSFTYAKTKGQQRLFLIKTGLIQTESAFLKLGIKSPIRLGIKSPNLFVLRLGIKNPNLFALRLGKGGPNLAYAS